jgi:cell division protein FtsB
MVAKSKEKRKGRGVFLFLLAAFLVFIAVFLMISNIRIRQEREKIADNSEYLEEKVKILKDQNEEMKKGLGQAESRQVLEKVAKERLNLKAPGEQVIVVKRAEEKETTVQEEEKNAWNPKVWWEWIKEKAN